MTLATQTIYMAQRHARAFVRQPWFLGITLVQPMIWLLFFGSLFQNVVNIPGFSTSNGSYLDYLTPGVVVMTALFSSGWSGMGVLEDLDRGILDRFLVAPVHRSSLIYGRSLYNAVTVVIQSLIVGGIGVLMGARYSGGVLGFGVLIVAAVLLGACFGALSDGMALVVRQRESLIGVNTFVVLPLTFASSAFLPLNLAPSWIATVAKVNPLNWAVEAGRAALGVDPDWTFVAVRLAALLLAALLCAGLGTRAFRSYQRSV